MCLLGEPLAVRPSFDALLERVFRNFTGSGVPKTEAPETMGQVRVEERSLASSPNELSS